MAPPPAGCADLESSFSIIVCALMGFKDWIAAITGRRPQPPGAVDPAPPAAPTESDIMRALDRVEDMVDGGVVPAPVQSRVRRVAQTVRDTMPRLRNLGLGSPDAYSVMATATDYLPKRSARIPGCRGSGPTRVRSRMARPH